MLITASAAGIVRSLSEATYSGLVEEELFGGLKDDSFWNLSATFGAVTELARYCRNCKRKVLELAKRLVVEVKPMNVKGWKQKRMHTILGRGNE